MEPQKSDLEPVTVRLPASDLAWLVAYAEREHVSVSRAAAMIIRDARAREAR